MSRALIVPDYGRDKTPMVTRSRVGSTRVACKYSPDEARTISPCRRAATVNRIETAGPLRGTRIALVYDAIRGDAP